MADATGMPLLDLEALELNIFRDEDIKPGLEEMLLDKDAREMFRARLRNWKLPENASHRVAKLAYEMMGLDQITAWQN